MKSYFLFIFCVLICCNAEGDQSSVDAIVRKFLDRPEAVDLSTITDNNREAIVSQLRLYAIGNGPRESLNNFEGEAIFALLRLDDSKTEDIFMDDFKEEARKTGFVSGFLGHNSPHWSDLWEDAGQPSLIPRFAEYLHAEDGDKIDSKGTDALILVYPPSIGSGRIIVGIIANSVAFNKKTHAWAQAVYKLISGNPYQVDLPKFRKMMVEWWTANKGFFEKKNYMAVKPGPSVSQVKIPSTQK